MVCPYCGHELKPGARFCGSCGKPVADVPTPASGPVAEHVAQPVPTSAPTGAAAPAWGASPQKPWQAAAAAGPAYPPPAPDGVGGYPDQPYGMQANNGFGSTQPGCLGSAWRDITSSPGWGKRMVLLMALNCVPVLNLYVSGYCIRWGCEQAAGERNPMPVGGFTKRAFLSGVFITVLGILGAFAATAFAPVTLIPIIGFMIFFAIVLFIQMFYRLAIMRAGMLDRLGEAFQLSDIVQKSRRRMGSLFAAACVPNIIAGAITGAIFLILLMCALAQLSATYNAMWGSITSGTVPWMYGHALNLWNIATNPVGFLLWLLYTFIVWFVILSLLLSVLMAFAQIWSFRALGHWVDRYAPEWKAEAQQQRGATVPPARG